jgi:hypothetical protein
VASLDFAAPKLGSGARFKKLSSALAARGAHDPDALAAFIGRKKYGTAKMAKLSAHAHSNPATQIAWGTDYIQGQYGDPDIYLSVTTTDSQGFTLTCPECNYSGPASSFGADGASLDKQPGELRTPAPGTGSVRDGAATTVRGGSDSHALSNVTPGAIGLTSGTLTARTRRPVSGPMDVLVARGDDGTAVLRHRHGGGEIAQLRKDATGKWVATVAGKDLAPRDHQRTALMEAVSSYNAAVTGSLRPAPGPLQPPPQQTELMAEYGIPAIRALATPTTSSSGGGRVTAAGGSGKYDPDDDGDDDSSASGDTDKDYAGGLNAKGQAIYKKLIAKGFTKERALAFAKRAQNTKAGAFGQAAS